MPSKPSESSGGNRHEFVPQEAHLFNCNVILELKVPWSIVEKENDLRVIDAKGRVFIVLEKHERQTADDLVNGINSGKYSRIDIAAVPQKISYETGAAQQIQEIEALADLAKAENVCSVLEVGSRFGGSLWKLANAIPPGSRIVSVDLPTDQGCWDSLNKCANALRARGYEVHLIRGDSTDKDVVVQAEALAPFDLVFIDGDHRWDYVESDWHNYGQLGRIVAFHDICWEISPGMDVPRFWDELKMAYRHQEFSYSIGLNSFGIGVLWR